MPQRARGGCCDSSTTRSQACRAEEQSSCNSTNLSTSYKAARCQLSSVLPRVQVHSRIQPAHAAYGTWPSPHSRNTLNITGVGNTFLFSIYTALYRVAQKIKKDEPAVVHPRSAHWKKEGLLCCWINHPNSLTDWDWMQIPTRKSRAKPAKQATALLNHGALSPSGSSARLSARSCIWVRAVSSKYRLGGEALRRTWGCWLIRT